MSKGEETRQTILSHAMGLASALGLEGLSIGRLATDLKLSKSGLFAHFQSKEALQIQVLEVSAELFAEKVVRPALAKPRGVARIRALFDLWIEWGRARALQGGCIFVAASAELDDRPGPVRDRLVALQAKWVDTMCRLALGAIETGEFRADTDTEQFAQELYGILLCCHHYARLLRDPRAERRARAAFERLLEGFGAPAAAKKGARA